MDLLRFYGVDLVEALRVGRPSPRFLYHLIMALPQGTLTGALLNDEERLWGYTREVAAIADVYDNVSVNTVATGFAKKPARPEAWPLRPGLGERKRGKTAPGSAAALRRMFEQMMNDER